MQYDTSMTFDIHRHQLFKATIGQPWRNLFQRAHLHGGYGGCASEPGHLLWMSVKMNSKRYTKRKPREKIQYISNLSQILPHHNPSLRRSTTHPVLHSLQAKDAPGGGVEGQWGSQECIPHQLQKQQRSNQQLSRWFLAVVRHMLHVWFVW